MQGHLSEFRLAEILQLVAVQQKTGLLRLARGKQHVTFYFDHGLLVSTRDRRHVTFDPLLEYLARVGFLQPEMAQHLRDKMEGSKEDVADVLLGERFLTEEELRGALEDLAQELVYHIFMWRDGTYQFIGGDEALTGVRYRLGLKIESVLMEGARRADEWPRLFEKLPGPDVVLDLVRNPGTTLGDRALHVLSQIHGIMRLGDLQRRARIPEYDVYEIVAQAVDAGIVRIVERPEPVAVSAVSPPRPAVATRSPRSHIWTLPRPLGWSLALLLSVLSALGAWLLAPRLTIHPAHDATQELVIDEARESLRLQIEVYRTLRGHYPASLADLEAADLASPELLRRAAPARYAVTPDGQGFELSNFESNAALQRQ